MTRLAASVARSGTAHREGPGLPELADMRLSLPTDQSATATLAVRRGFRL